MPLKSNLMKHWFFSLSILVILLFSSCAPRTESMAKYTEPFRPQFHFSPDSMWMNDPNGLVFDGKEYHLFYQHHPEDIVWGPMHWGHATSSDLVYWKHQPIALYPDENGTIFSGSAVMDIKNTSGLGTKAQPPMVAIFTYHDPVGAEQQTNNFQTQGMAYSLDQGKSWTKYPGNPILKNPGYVDFRDPKVFWHEETSSWVMAVVAGDHMQLYRSDNLIDWSLTSTFGQEVGAHGGVWECPDLFALELNGETHWVLLISINPGGPNGGSATQYFIGDFDGYAFSSEQSAIKWVDFGPDNYAGVTYNNTPNDERLFIGWMNNWSYAQSTPTERWRSASTLPRILSLYETAGEVFLKNTPIAALDQLKLAAPIVRDVHGESTRVQLPASQSYLQLALPFQSTSFSLSNSNNEELSVRLDTETATLVIDRSRSGSVAFSEAFNTPISLDLSSVQTKNLVLDLWIDSASIELFINGGQVSATLQYFSSAPFDFLTYDTMNEAIEVTQLAGIKSIW